MRSEITPKNILMIGPTGVGKTEIARRLARLANAPFVKVEATKFTEVGYVGRDVESIIRDLAEIGVAMVRAEHATRLQEQAQAHVEERLLALLVPEEANTTFAMPFVLPGMQIPQVQQTPDEIERRRQQREELRARLRAGTLESVPVELDVADETQSSQMASMFTQMAGDEMGR